MITQKFLLEFESSLLRSYARAARRTVPRNQRDPSFVGNSQYKEDFLKEFAAGLQERKEILEEEVRRGGHKNSSLIVEKAMRMAEEKVRGELTVQQLNHKELDEHFFKKVVRDLNRDVRSVFY